MVEPALTGLLGSHHADEDQYLAVASCLSSLRHLYLKVQLPVMHIVADRDIKGKWRKADQLSGFMHMKRCRLKSVTVMIELSKESLDKIRAGAREESGITDEECHQYARALEEALLIE